MIFGIVLAKTSFRICQIFNSLSSFQIFFQVSFLKSFSKSFSKFFPKYVFWSVFPSLFTKSISKSFFKYFYKVFSFVLCFSNLCPVQGVYSLTEASSIETAALMTRKNHSRNLLIKAVVYKNLFTSTLLSGAIYIFALPNDFSWNKVGIQVSH